MTALTVWPADRREWAAGGVREPRAARRLLLRQIGAMLVMGLACAPAARAQAPAERIEVELLAGTGAPGEDVPVSIMIKVPADETSELAKVQATVTFPGTALHVKAVNPGTALAADGFRVSHAVDDQKPGTAVVTVEKVGDVPLPRRGELARMMFVVGQGVDPGNVVLENVARVWTVGTPEREVPQVTSLSGNMEVIPGAPVLYACFFFMH
jgi:hypothetical protein